MHRYNLRSKPVSISGPNSGEIIMSVPTSMPPPSYVAQPGPSGINNSRAQNYGSSVDPLVQNINLFSPQRETITNTVNTCNSMIFSSHNSQSGSTGGNISIATNANMFGEQRVQGGNLTHSQGEKTQNLLDIPIPMVSEMSNAEKIRHQLDPLIK